MKKSVRKAQNPIAQVTKRIVEMEKMNCRQLPKRIHISVSTQKKDSCFLLKSREIVFVKEKRDDKKYVCDVLKRSNLESFYDSPCNSKLLNTVVVKKKEHASQKEVTGTHRFRKEIDLFTMGQRISSHSNAAWDGTMVNIHVRLSWIS